MEIKFSLIDFVLISPAVALFCASIIPLAIKVMRGNREQNPFATMIYAFIGVISAAVLTVATRGLQSTAFHDALVFDGISNWTVLVILLVLALALTFSRDNLATNNRQFSEYVFLLLNSAVGMMTVVWSNDLIILFVGIELMSLCLYMLIALSSEETLSKEAAFKYFVLGSFASALLLYGIALVYGTGQSTYLPVLTESATQLMSTNRLFLIGTILVIIGMAFKVSIFPFHSWTPDVYQGAPTPITAFMATGVKAACLAFFLRIMGMQILVSERAVELVNVLQWLAVLTMLVGNIAAVMQSNLKRMLAYSSVAHSGYALIGLLAAGVGGQSVLGASGVVFYIFAYALMTIGAFGVISLLESRADSALTVDDLKGLASSRPLLAFCITVFMLSLAGIPPTIGFFGKFFIFSAAVKQGFFWLAVWGVISSVISVYYYLRPVVAMYMQERESSESFAEGRALSQFAIMLVALLVLGIGILSDPFYAYVVKSVSSAF